MKRLIKPALAVIGLLALSISLSSCSTPEATDASGDKKQSSDHSAHSMDITDRKSFALAMIPHHEQALEMAQIALENTSNPDVLAIANTIIAEQAAEVEMMTPWLEDQSVDYDMMMDGMLTSSQLEELRSTKDAEFDVLFSQYMIMHHEGAIAMANKVIESEDIFLSELGYQIIEEQTKEISLLEAIRTN
jgi:uncharacterized protein (DUF305 family)